MSLGRAKEHLAQFGKADDVMEFETSSATVELTPADLEATTPGSTWVDVCKLPED